MKVERTKILLISGANHNPVVVMKQQLRFVHDHFGRWFTHLELCAHFLDLRGLLFELRGQNFHSFLLLRDSGLQFLALSCALLGTR